MLNKMKIALATAIVVAAMGSNAAFAASKTGTATVEIVTPVVLSNVAQLNLGLVAATATAGTVTIPVSANTQSCSGVVCLGGSSRGSFQVTAAANNAVIDLSADASTTLTGPGANMALGLFLSKNSITFNSASLETVYVGGALDVAANQVAGTYTGSYNVTANYQ